MFEIFFAIFMAMSCPAHIHTDKCHHGSTITTQDTPTDDTGGEDGHVPPKPPKPIL